MITEDFVSFEIAKLLKEKGFDEPCYAYWHEDENKLIVSQSPHAIRNFTNRCFFGPATPTLQMAMKWLREEYNIHISIYIFNRELPVNSVPIYTCDIATEKLSSQEGHLRGMWKTYEEACEAAIKYCLTNML